MDRRKPEQLTPESIGSIVGDVLRGFPINTVRFSYILCNIASAFTGKGHRRCHGMSVSSRVHQKRSTERNPRTIPSKDRYRHT